MVVTIASIALALGCSSSDGPLPLAKPFLMKGHHFVVCAHRGDHTKAPENTLDGLEESIKDGVDYVELDLRLSKDGTIVIMHDGTVDRTTDGKGTVSDLTLAEIRALHIKKARRENEQVPTFEEYLKRSKGKVRLYMDIKAVHPAQVLPLLHKYRMDKEVIAYVYGPSQRDEWRAQAPAIPLISDLEQLQSPEQIEAEWHKSPFAISDGGAFDYKPEFITKWHALGVAVVPDIQNPLEGPAQWQKMIDMGVDGLQSDHPGALIAYLMSKGIR